METLKYAVTPVIAGECEIAPTNATTQTRVQAYYRVQYSQPLVGCEVIMPKNTLVLKIVFDREVDGRWIADIPALPGVLVYGATKDEAEANAKQLALYLLSDELEHKERSAESLGSIVFSPA